MKNIKFTDFCSGIGERISLENLGMTCLGFSEIGKDVKKPKNISTNAE